MPIALSPGEEFEYVLKRDRDKPEEERRRFRLRALTRAEERKIAKTGNDSKGNLTDPEARLELSLSLGLVGWNLTAPGGAAIPFAMPQALEFLNVYDRFELYRAIETRGEDGVAAQELSKSD